MAKVGEGDPRWLVENREDGRNVNNWHWSETDCLGWSKKKFTSDLSSLVIVDNDEMNITTGTNVTVTGECTSNNRKGKTIFLYDLEVKVSWKGELKATQTKASGDFVMPYISDENADELTKVNVSMTDDSSSDTDKLKEAARKLGIPMLQKIVQQYDVELKKTFTLKPVQKAAATTSQDSQPIQSITQTSAPAAEAAAAPKTTTSNSSTSTRTLKIKDEFKASPMDAYDAFVNVQKMRAYTQSDCVFDGTDGGKFSLYGGHIQGTNTQLSPGAKIVQKWRISSWAEGHYSTVTITFSVADKPATVVEIVQTGIPAEEYEKTEEGWHRNILERLKMVLGYGSKIYS